MQKVPLVLRLGQQSIRQDNRSIDGLTCEDPMPAVLASTSDGYILARGTAVTDVHHETMDDK